MGKTVYVYIFEDGTLAQSSIPPLHEDLRAIEQGMLQVLMVKGSVAGYDNDNTLYDLEEVVPDATNNYHEL